MRRLGVDTGSKNIGVALYDSNNNIIEYQAEWNPTSYSTLYDDWKEFLLNQVIDKIIFEKPFYTTNTLPNGYKVIETIGILKLGCSSFGIPYYNMSPASVKKRFTGNGKASKDDIKAEVVKRFKLNLKSTHINDAIAIAVGWDE